MTSTTQQSINHTQLLLSNEFLSSSFLPSNPETLQSVLPKLTRLSEYLSQLHSFPSKQSQTTITSYFIRISLDDFYTFRPSNSPNFTLTILLLFTDLMRLTAPDLPFEIQTLLFYLEYLSDWITSYTPTDSTSSSMSPDIESKIEHLFIKTGKINTLSFASTYLFEKIPLIIDRLFLIQKTKRYECKSEIFNSFVNIIVGILEETTPIPMNIIVKLFIYLNKAVNACSYELAKAVLTQMKNTLSEGINELLVCNDIKLLPIEGKDFCVLVKELNKINCEFIVSLFIKFSSGKFKHKVNNTKYIDIIMKVFASTGSEELVTRYSDLFVKMVNKYIQKSNMKLKVFECLVKFLYKNKIKIKDNGNSGSLGIVFAEKIKQCLTDIKSDVM